MQLLWVLLVAFIATMGTAIAANYDAPLAAGLMVGASFYLIGFTVLAVAGSAKGRRIFGGLLLVLGSVSVASSLLITAFKTYAKYFPQ